MKNILLAVSILSAAAFLAATAIAQPSPSCFVSRDFPASYRACEFLWQSVPGGYSRYGHVTPYQDEYGRDVFRAGHLYH